MTEPVKESLENTRDIQVAPIKKPKHLWKKGESGNPLGKPKGAISPIQRVKQIFKNNPKMFEAFIAGYITDPGNRKHIVEMLDGKPKEKVELEIKPKMVHLDD